MSESRVLSEIELAAATFKICVLPRNSLRLSVSPWSLPDPAFHIGVIWRTNTGASRIGRRFVRFGISGTPDYEGFLFKGGRRMTIEAKSDKGTENANQRAYSKLAHATGVLHGVVRSYADCVELLDSWGLRRPV